jgi:type III restriction enzyme
VKLANGEIKRQLKRLEFRDDLFAEEKIRRAGSIPRRFHDLPDRRAERHGRVHQRRGAAGGEATGDVSERDIRRIQIRETIKAHLDKERQLFVQGVKVLSLFFIDEVVKYRDYTQADEEANMPACLRR